jgi:shikimate kinase
MRRQSSGLVRPPSPAHSGAIAEFPQCEDEPFMSHSAEPDPSPSVVASFTPARTVVLIGLMGSGKSSVGRKLAQRLALSFRDADSEIEHAAGLSIPEIFATHGEAYFRDGERRVIARLLDEPPHILATGGGAYMDSRTRAAIAAKGLSIWLRVELDELVRRTARRNHRPLLNQGDPRQILASLMEQRYPVYADADITVDGGAGDVDEMVDRVLAALIAYSNCAKTAPAHSE